MLNCSSHAVLDLCGRIFAKNLILLCLLERESPVTVDFFIISFAVPESTYPPSFFATKPISQAPHKQSRLLNYSLSKFFSPAMIRSVVVFMYKCASSTIKVDSLALLITAVRKVFVFSPQIRSFIHEKRFRGHKHYRPFIERVHHLFLPSAVLELSESLSNS